MSERPIDSSRVTFRAALVASLLLATASGTWAVSRTLSRMEAKLDALSVPALNARYFTRAEASVYHRDLEHVLQDAGLKLRFPPPRDPSTSTP